MTTSLSSLNILIFPHCLQNKTQISTAESPSPSPTWLPHLSLPLTLPFILLNFHVLKGTKGGHFYFASKTLHMLFSVFSASNILPPFNFYSSFSSDILLPESLTWNPGYRLIPLPSVLKAPLSLIRSTSS